MYDDFQKAVISLATDEKCLKAFNAIKEFYGKQLENRDGIRNEQRCLVASILKDRDQSKYNKLVNGDPKHYVVNKDNINEYVLGVEETVDYLYQMNDLALKLFALKINPMYDMMNPRELRELFISSLAATLVIDYMDLIIKYGINEQKEYLKGNVIPCLLGFAKKDEHPLSPVALLLLKEITPNL